MKFFRKIFLIIGLFISLIYVTNITNIPKNIILFEGEQLNLGTIFGIIQTKEPIVTTSFNGEESNIVYQEKIKLSLFNIFNVKDVNVTTIENTKVIPLGNTIGLKLYSSGVLVIGMTEIEGNRPYENTGIKEGDLIIYVNKTQVTTTNELINCVNASNGEILEITYIRNGQEYVTNIEPTKTVSNEYKLRIMGKRWGCRNRNSHIL